mmetsp:Transcript_17506/g.14599  ORF Transcript_17506/g.14599 Transcript_17506/m.14599 type:complete len:117 (-) Transcript_17506:236-586(-)
MSWNNGGGRVCHNNNKVLCQCTYLSVIQARLGYTSPEGWTNAQVCDYTGTPYASTTTSTPGSSSSNHGDIPSSSSTSSSSYSSITAAIVILDRMNYGPIGRIMYFIACLLYILLYV